jgi:hypothetical protein
MRKLAGTSIRRSLEFFIYALAGQNIQIMHTFAKLIGIVEHPIVEFHFQIDAGSP